MRERLAGAARLWRVRRRTGPTGPPDFIGVGFQLTGALWWYKRLLRHPQIHGPVGGQLELHFFDAFCGREMTAADVSAYAEHFPRPAGSVCGEWTTRYARDPWVPRLIARAAPEARLLVMVSDPVERFRARLGGLEGRRPTDEEQPFFAQAVLFGRYASMLEALFEHVDRERVLVQQVERCRAEPLEEYARTLRFLGVRDDYVPRGLRRRARGPRLLALRLAAAGALKRAGLWERLRPASEAPPADLWPDIEAALHAELDPEVERLRELVPHLDLELWPAFAHLARPAAVSG